MGKIQKVVKNGNSLELVDMVSTNGGEDTVKWEVLGTESKQVYKNTIANITVREADEVLELLTDTTPFGTTVDLYNNSEFDVKIKTGEEYVTLKAGEQLTLKWTGLKWLPADKPPVNVLEVGNMNAPTSNIVKTQFNAVDSSLSDLEADLAAAGVNIKNLQTTVNGHTTSINTINTNISNRVPTLSSNSTTDTDSILNAMSSGGPQILTFTSNGTTGAIPTNTGVHLFTVYCNGNGGMRIQRCYDIAGNLIASRGWEWWNNRWGAWSYYPKATYGFTRVSYGGGFIIDSLATATLQVNGKAATWQMVFNTSRSLGAWSRDLNLGYFLNPMGVRLLGGSGLGFNQGNGDMQWFYLGADGTLYMSLLAVGLSAGAWVYATGSAVLA